MNYYKRALKLAPGTRVYTSLRLQLHKILTHSLSNFDQNPDLVEKRIHKAINEVLKPFDFIKINLIKCQFNVMINEAIFMEALVVINDTHNLWLNEMVMESVDEEVCLSTCQYRVIKRSDDYDRYIPAYDTEDIVAIFEDLHNIGETSYVETFLPRILSNFKQGFHTMSTSYMDRWASRDGLSFPSSTSRFLAKLDDAAVKSKPLNNSLFAFTAQDRKSPMLKLEDHLQMKLAVLTGLIQPLRLGQYVRVKDIKFDVLYTSPSAVMFKATVTNHLGSFMIMGASAYLHSLFIPFTKESQWTRKTYLSIAFRPTDQRSIFLETKANYSDIRGYGMSDVKQEKENATMDTPTKLSSQGCKEYYEDRFVTIPQQKIALRLKQLFDDAEAYKPSDRQDFLCNYSKGKINEEGYLIDKGAIGNILGFLSHNKSNMSIDRVIFFADLLDIPLQELFEIPKTPEGTTPLPSFDDQDDKSGRILIDLDDVPEVAEMLRNYTGDEETGKRLTNSLMSAKKVLTLLEPYNKA